MFQKDFSADLAIALSQQPSKLVYLAGPYSHPSQVVVDARMEVVSKAIAELSQKGFLIVSPMEKHFSILTNETNTIPSDWTYWQHLSRELLTKCGAIVVLRLPEYFSSVGLQGELEIANKSKIPVLYSDEIVLDV